MPEKKPYDLTQDIASSLSAADTLKALQLDINQVTRSLDVARSVAKAFSGDTRIADAIRSVTNHGLVAKSLIADNQRLAATLRDTLGPFNERFVEQLRKSLASFDPFSGFLPENLREAAPQLRDLEPLLLDEGIPLMWVPRSETVSVLLDAPDAAARRRIVGARWRGIVGDCETAINTIDHPELLQSREFALDCVNALRAGHPHPAQALSANLLDSLMRAHVSEPDRVQLTRNRQGADPFDLSSYSARIALTFAPVWSAHAEYWPNNGDPIPRNFGRHPSAHGVSRNQYSRINAIYGLMLVTSVLKLFDAEMDR